MSGRKKSNSRYGISPASASSVTIGLIFHELDDNLIDLAANLAYEEKITFYDSVYLALAKALNATLITADANLHDQIGEQNESSVMLLKEYDDFALQRTAQEDPKRS